MQKIIFFLLAVISFSVQARANWNPYSMNHERFVHLSEADKQAVIISTMELMVELESKYETEVKTSGFSSERFQEYVQLLQKFQNLIISSAYAAEPGPLTKLAGQFSDLLKRLEAKGNGCIYGGYVSIMGTLNGKKYCRHPSTMRSSIPDEAEIKKAYLTRGTGPTSCVGPKKITCNPVIFGYQDTAGTVPLCVETSNLQGGKGHNVSYECMKKALAEPDKEARLSVLTKAMSENKEAFEKVHSFIFRTCACKDKTTLNKDYAAYMKPHRTCYGLMNTLRVVNTNECGQLNKVEPGTDFANDWSRYFGNEAVFPKLEPEKSATFDKVYGSLIDKDAVQAICDGKPAIIPTPIDPVEDPEVIIPEKDKSEWVCTTTCKVQEPVAPVTEKRMQCEYLSAGWNITKAGATEAVFTDIGLKGKTFQIDDITKTSFKEKVKDPANPETEIEQECPITVAPEEAAAPTCTIAVVDEEDKLKAKATVTISGLKDKEEAVVVWTGGVATPELPNEILVDKIKGATTDVSVVFTIKDAAVVPDAAPLTCSAVVTALEETDPGQPAYTIKATAETATDTSVKVNAVITIDSKEEKVPAGFKISWTRKGTGVAKLPKVTEKTTTTDAGVQDTPAEGEEVTVETPPIVTAGEVATGDSITEQRVADPYDTCATLIDEKGIVKAGPSCAPIPKTKVEKTNPYQNNSQQPQPQQQPSFFFQGQNTATQGF